MATKTDEIVKALIGNIKSTQLVENEEVMSTKNSKANESVQVPNQVMKQETIRGKPKSGRFWKSNKERFSSINKTKGLRSDFQKKTALRLELQRIKELSRQVVHEMKAKELARKERRRENLKRAEENQRKAEVVQVITNTAKLKRMKKKQLRFIEKRDTTNVETNK